VSGEGAGASAAPSVLTSAEVFATYHERIRRYMLSMVHDLAQAEDLTQDVFLQVHRRLDSLRDPDALVVWLYRVATRVAYDSFRKSGRQPQTETLEDENAVERIADDDDAGAARLDRVVERSEMSACVRNYMEDLSPEYRQVIVLHDLEELSNPEIAERLGASLDTVKIRLHRARRKLQAVLEAQCDFSFDDQGVFVCEQAEVAQTGRSNQGTDCASRK
jgi:RNA polymerase sigma-70 factor, ECF subfamily